MSNPPATNAEPAESRIFAPVWLGRAALLVFLGYLLWRAWRARTAPYVPVDWAFQRSDDALAWLSGLLWRELRIVGLALMLGLLTPPALATLPVDWIRRSRLNSLLTSALFGLAVIYAALAFAWNDWPPPGSLLLPILGNLLGIHLSSAALRGWRSLGWAAGQVAALAAIALGGTLVAARLALSDAPLDIDARAMSMAEKRELAGRIRATRPPDDQPRRLQLTDDELAALMNSAIGRGGAPRKAGVHLFPEWFVTEVSLGLPGRQSQRRFLNARLAGQVSIDRGHLWLRLQELTVGRLSAPRWLLRVMSGSAHAALMEDPQLRRIIEAVSSLETEDGAVTAVFQPGALGRQVAPSLVQLLWERPDVSQETRLYLVHLTETFDRLPRDSDRFALLMQSAFELARQRSSRRPAALENRAALFALAILLGHEDLEPFVGELFDPALRAKARAMAGRVTLRGRADFPRHFLVSAALKLLSDEAVSDRVGVLKEQIDSQHGGSGFSFPDLLANMAGIRFALLATQDESSARALQAQVAEGFDVERFFPPIDGLPEGMSSAELQSQYGGIGGAGYREVLAEIERRLGRLPPLGAK